VVLTARGRPATVRRVSSFQPAGRAPAPPPLDAVQDFANTLIPEWSRDDIASPAELGSWLASRGLLGPGPAPGPTDLDTAHALRSALRALALRNSTGSPPSGAARVEIDEALRALPFEVALDEWGMPCARPVPGGAAGALAALVAIVLDAVRDGTWPRLKACRKQSCGWVFFDRSRNRSSNWCSMGICGNRAKTASYRRRKAER
jgi:predicted RNA-binding Zn ribbon-like protein